MTFGQWFKKKYPNESAHVKKVARHAWKDAVEVCVEAAKKVPIQ